MKKPIDFWLRNNRAPAAKKGKAVGQTKPTENKNKGVPKIVYNNRSSEAR